MFQSKFLIKHKMVYPQTAIGMAINERNEYKLLIN